jgi:hypothetical protein
MLPDLNNNKKHAQGADFHGFLSKHVTFASLKIERGCFSPLKPAESGLALRQAKKTRK